MPLGESTRPLFNCTSYKPPSLYDYTRTVTAVMGSVKQNKGERHALARK